MLKKILSTVLALTLTAGSAAISAAAITIGDVNDDGSINVADISKLAAHIKGVRSLEGDELTASDVNGDGKISVTDLSAVAGHVKGIKDLGNSNTDVPAGKADELAKIVVDNESVWLDGINDKQSSMYGMGSNEMSFFDFDLDGTPELVSGGFWLGTHGANSFFIYKITDNGLEPVSVERNGYENEYLSRWRYVDFNSDLYYLYDEDSSEHYYYYIDHDYIDMGAPEQSFYSKISVSDGKIIIDEMEADPRAQGLESRLIEMDFLKFGEDLEDEYTGLSYDEKLDLIKDMIQKQLDTDVTKPDHSYEARLKALTEFRTTDEYDYNYSKYELCDINGDDIPELFISPADFHVSKVKVYFFNGSEYEYLGDYGESGCVLVDPENSYIITGWMGQGYNSRTVLKFDGQSVETVISFSDNDGATDKENEKYFKIDDEEVTRDEYYEKYSMYINDNVISVGPKDSF